MKSDGRQIELHLDVLFSSSTEGYIGIRAYDRNTARMVQTKFFDISNDATPALISMWAARQSRLNRDVFICPVPRASESLRQGTSVEKCSILYADLDHSHPLPPELARHAHIVNTGTKGHRHVYFTLTDALPIEEHQRYNKALARLLNGDTKWPENALLRLAGTPNTKEGVGRLARLGPPDGPVPAVPLDVLRRVLKPETQRRVRATQTSWKLLDDVPRVTGLAASLLRDDDCEDGTARYKRTQKLVCLLLEKGYDCDHVHTYMERHQPTLSKWPGFDTRHNRIQYYIDDWLSRQKPGALVATTDLWSSTPVLKYLFNFAKARRVPPWSLLGAVLADVIASVPPSLKLPAFQGTEASLNLFVALVSPSGGGKSMSMSASQEVFADRPEITRRTIGSGEGIAKLYRQKVRDGKETHEEWLHTKIHIASEEIGEFAAMGSRSGSTFATTLNKAAMGEELGFSYADADKALSIPRHQYRMSLSVGVQPERADPLINEEGSGLPQRFIWMQAFDEDRWRGHPEPEQMKWPVPWIDSLTPQVMKFPEEARDWVYDEMDKNSPKSFSDSSLDTHLPLTRMKVAAALALLSGHVEVDIDDWNLSQHIMNHSNNTRAHTVDELRKRDFKDARKKGELSAVQRKAQDNYAKDENYWLTQAKKTVCICLQKGIHTEGKMKPQFKGEKAKYLEIALKEMLRDGDIEEMPTRRKDSVAYRLAIAEDL